MPAEPPVDHAAAPPGSRPDAPVPPWPGRRRGLDAAALVLVAAAGVALRVVQRSPLWLDEALSATIAGLPLGDIPEALRHDGHPPLYYVVLHGWQEVVGRGDGAVRLLSGLVGLALPPLAWVAAGRIAGRRAAWAAALLVTLNPFVLRYATEARMYELVMVLVLAGWLVADRALARPTAGRLVALAALTGALLWTHYWGLWLAGAAGVGVLALAAGAHRRGDRPARAAALRVAAALAVGGLSFLPWVPSLLEQAAHTGTPWATPSVPTEMAASSILDLGGGTAGESVLLGIVLVLLCALGLLARPGRGPVLEVEARVRPEVRRLAVLVTGTLVLAAAVSYATQAAYASRYFSVVAPLVLVLAGVGAGRLTGPAAFRVVLAGALALGAVAGVRAAVSDPRSQAREVAAAIVAAGPVTGPDGALVLVCPDQLGPALVRALPAGADVRSYPALDRADVVDWVDYEDRLAAADPARVAAQALGEADGRAVWLVWSGGYRTHEGTCEALVNEILRVRPSGHPVVAPDPDAYEPATAFLYPG